MTLHYRLNQENKYKKLTKDKQKSRSIVIVDRREEGGKQRHNLTLAKSDGRAATNLGKFVMMFDGAKEVQQDAQYHKAMPHLMRMSKEIKFPRPTTLREPGSIQHSSKYIRQSTDTIKRHRKLDIKIILIEPHK
mmetsp:Transcript_44232/g.50913  ORF Transcript_44232/g.50913 Transcript_44232/m.50913 type:complete len:134 (-) Transcript_44232:1226-1627(-)